MSTYMKYVTCKEINLERDEMIHKSSFEFPPKDTRLNQHSVPLTLTYAFHNYEPLVLLKAAAGLNIGP